MIESQKPNYLTGMITYIVANVLVIILLCTARWKMATINRYRLARSSGVVTNVEDDLSDVADPNYIYTM